jgi:hypothetical protein
MDEPALRKRVEPPWKRDAIKNSVTTFDLAAFQITKVILQCRYPR